MPSVRTSQRTLVTKRTLLKNKDWASIDGKVCLVNDFVPMAAMSNGRVTTLGPTVPYASVHLTCEDSSDQITAFICHKIDFATLWAAFRERTKVPGTRLEIRADVESPEDLSLSGLGENEEVWLVWTRTRYKPLTRPFKWLFPSLIVMVVRKGAFELYRNRDLQPDLTGEARFKATSPLATWLPLVMQE